MLKASRRFACVILALSFGLLQGSASLAAEKWEETYNQAIAAYKARDYGKASTLFWQSINEGNGSASAWFYLAHSKAGEGKLAEARETYQSVVKIYKDSPEAVASAGYIRALDAHTWNPGPKPGATKPSAPGGKAPAATTPGAAPAATAVAAPTAGKVEFKSRIEIIPPRDGHPAVSAQMIETIRRTISSLPPSIYKILDQGSARVFLGPNIIDKWPDALDDPKPGSAGETLAMEPGRTYGRDIYIYERSIATKGSRELGEPYSSDDIRSYFLHEVGHAVDDCLGVYSKDPGLKAAYKMDCEGLGEDTREQLSYYMQGGDAGAAEVCAETVQMFLGGHKHDNDAVARAFRRSQAWVKAKLKI
ncbi:MAG: hypothetical protein JST01_08100 [Cyanobacteria bacterium SZAS TMP-1]|nr:hypothetical protein [Cyanobacteria bacterium SZAS TMP-1]